MGTLNSGSEGDEVDIVCGAFCAKLLAKNFSSGSSHCILSVDRFSHLLNSSTMLASHLHWWPFGQVAFCWDFGLLYGYFYSFYNCQISS